MMRTPRISQLLLFLIVIILLPTAFSFGQNEVALGVDLSADESESPATEAVPWASAGLSLSGYPTDAVSWFFDGAGRGELAVRSQTATVAGSLLATGTLRRGLGMLRVDIEGFGDVSTGNETGSVSGDMSLFGSTGSARHSVYSEVKGGVMRASEDTTWSSSGLLGGSLTIGNQVAPDASLRGSYTWLPDGGWRSRLGADLTVPWYPPMPATVSVGVSGYRGLGNTRYAVGDAWYYPDQYWELGWNGELAYSLTRRMTAELLLPGSLRWYLHGPVVDGVMQDGQERVTSFSPGLSLRGDLGGGFSAVVEVGGDLTWSNSPSLDNLRGYLSTSVRYGF
ncbi:MAG: hypothetical protein GVY29_00660 [Spirochaetes bacterium]|jgi:hypothetical protein|nr:hypothetical protein [Spirochaetota bacterium]